MTEPTDLPREFVEATQAAGLPPGVANPAETRLVPGPEPVRDVIKIDEAQLHQHLDQIVRDSVEQTLNGLQLGVTLFLIAAGLTLVLGVMNLVNLAHGSLYMLGAFLAAWLAPRLGSLFLALPLALVGVALIGAAIELVVLRRLYARDHLDQVLATFGLILFFNELTKVVWGPVAIFMDVPPALSGRSV